VPSYLVDVVLPCLNEQAALPGLLASLPEGYRAIVVDNGSTDASARVAREFGAVVVDEPRRGFGSAAHAGLCAARAPIVAFCDADGSFDLAELPRVVDPICDGSTDLMLGRRLPVRASAWPIHARVANRLLARRLRGLTGAQLHDLGPMRAANRRRLLELGLRDRRSGYPLEMVLRAAEENWRIGEVGVTYRPRIGTSKVTGTVKGTVRAVADMSRQLRAATR
jgi:glycosyltransferase involved in cell wall biosynthesis